MLPLTIRLNPADNVVVARVDLLPGTAGGANIICFTTGRGSVFGCTPAPSLKLATNTPLYRRMEDDIDLDFGPIAEGDAMVAEMRHRIFDLVFATASGRRTKSEQLGFGGDEFTPWVLGAVL